MIEIQITFENGDKFITSPERLRLAPSKDANNVIFVAGGHGIAAAKNNPLQK